MLKLDINTAERDEILKLPGVGPQLADQILEGRPYRSINDLSKVKGIGPVTLERLEKLLSVTYPLEETRVDSTSVAEVVLPPPIEVSADLEEGSAVETEPERESIVSPSVSEKQVESMEDTNDQVAVEAPYSEARKKDLEKISFAKEKSPTALKKSKDVISRGEVWLIAAISATLAFVLALAASMGVIAGINGSLRFVRPFEIVQVSQSVMGLDTKIDLLIQDLDGLNSRLDNLEALSGRINAVEKEAMSLRVEVDEAASQVEAIDSQVNQVAEKLKTMESQINVFQSFFDGLRDLVESLYPSQGVP